MKQLGNLAIICAQRRSLLLQIWGGTVCVFVDTASGLCGGRQSRNQRRDHQHAARGAAYMPPGPGGIMRSGGAAPARWPEPSEAGEVLRLELFPGGVHVRTGRLPPGDTFRNLENCLRAGLVSVRRLKIHPEEGFQLFEAHLLICVRLLLRFKIRHSHPPFILPPNSCSHSF